MLFHFNLDLTAKKGEKSSLLRKKNSISRRIPLNDYEKKSDIPIYLFLIISIINQ